MSKVKVNNVPDYARKCPYWVVRLCPEDAKLWFWGAWDDEDEAQKVALEIGGLVVENEV